MEDNFYNSGGGIPYNNSASFGLSPWELLQAYATGMKRYFTPQDGMIPEAGVDLLTQTIPGARFGPVIGAATGAAGNIGKRFTGYDEGGVESFFLDALGGALGSTGAKLATQLSDVGISPTLGLSAGGKSPKSWWQKLTTAPTVGDELKSLERRANYGEPASAFGLNADSKAIGLSRNQLTPDTLPVEGPTLNNQSYLLPDERALGKRFKMSDVNKFAKKQLKIKKNLNDITEADIVKGLETQLAPTLNQENIINWGREGSQISQLPNLPAHPYGLFQQTPDNLLARRAQELGQPPVYDNFMRQAVDQANAKYIKTQQEFKPRYDAIGKQTEGVSVSNPQSLITRLDNIQTRLGSEYSPEFNADVIKDINVWKSNIQSKGLNYPATKKLRTAIGEKISERLGNYDFGEGTKALQEVYDILGGDEGIGTIAKQSDLIMPGFMTHDEFLKVSKDYSPVAKLRESGAGEFLKQFGAKLGEKPGQKLIGKDPSAFVRSATDPQFVKDFSGLSDLTPTHIADVLEGNLIYKNARPRSGAYRKNVIGQEDINQKQYFTKRDLQDYNINEGALLKDLEKNEAGWKNVLSEGDPALGEKRFNFIREYSVNANILNNRTDFWQDLYGGSKTIGGDKGVYKLNTEGIADRVGNMKLTQQERAAFRKLEQLNSKLASSGDKKLQGLVGSLVKKTINTVNPLK
jgi:hypothetical protein